MNRFFCPVLMFAQILFSSPLSFMFPRCSVNQKAITAELDDLHSTIQDIRTACLKIPPTSDDHFASVMSVSTVL